ncbi:nuclear transport factor 2 family protein [Ferrimonas marina]|uniref:Ketosteroid isomerase-related protein n=1 Tax=Ferrimonas marina TaxID=299255 RepID=A0A1M5Z3R7_9GAMM|nr:nuclear transport factor 2 family protein [Ferrimonas marina]SHI18885.1 Ketosteroid isomerase-related protein [Ferrimonas marina]
MSTNPKPAWLLEFAVVWQQELSNHNLDALDSVYHSEMLFEDPSGQIHGRINFKAHLAKLYQNVDEASFQLHEPVVQDNQRVAQPWTMTLRHPRLAGGDPVYVEGISLLTAQSGKIVSHRDYFDMGEMLYESIPLVGPLVRLVKNRVSP